jgi:hypothetical protein
MGKRIGLLVAIAALAAGPVHAQVCPTSRVAMGARDVNAVSGHVFEVWTATPDESGAGITWAEANACAQRVDSQPQPLPPALPEPRIAGHLATITSDAEDQFVEGLRLRAGLTRSEVWVGGQRDPNTNLWSWVNNEGPIETPVNIVIGTYQNWLSGEPNNAYNDAPSENWLGVGLRGKLSGPINDPGNVIGWNDEGNLANIGGFVVEYDYARTINDGCTGTGGATDTSSCGTIEGQTITFPPGAFKANSELTFSSFEFRDPRVQQDPVTGNLTCDNGGRRQLILFSQPEFNVVNATGQTVPGTLVIPEYLCGSPNFVVVRTFGKNISIPRGTVFTENNTSGILPGNQFDCAITALESPQQADVGVWQSLDGTEMWESKSTSPDGQLNGRFAGTAAELTTGCGSTLIKTRTKSNFVVGLHLDFGAGVAPGSAAEYNEMVALTQYKMSLLQQSVIEANSKNKIGKPNGQAALSQLNNAIARLAANDPVGARKKMEDFLKKVNQSTYVTNPQDPLEFNYNGDHLSRGENILFTLNHKVIPFKPVP